MDIDPYSLFPDLGIIDFLHFTRPFGYIVLTIITLVIIQIFISWRSYFQKKVINYNISIILSIISLSIGNFISLLFTIYYYRNIVFELIWIGENDIAVDSFCRAIYLVRLIPFANVILTILLVFVFLPIILNKWSNR